MLKSVKIIIAFALIPFSGFAQSQTFSIEGKVNQNLNGKFIKLYYEDAKAKKADSVAIKNGSFKLGGNVTAPVVAKLTLGNQEDGDRIDLFLSTGNIRVVAKDSIHYAAVTGSKLVLEHDLLVKRLMPNEDKIYNGLSVWKKMPEGAEKKAYLNKMVAGFDEYSRTKREIVHQFVKEYPASYVSLHYLNQLAPKSIANYETTYPYFAKLSPAVKETPLGKEFGARLLETKGKLTGEAFIDFVSTTPDGKQLSLKEIITKNKYTLVDFWASWCGPCRKENPHVVKTFKDFKDKGFTVLSVSLDDDGKKWKDAIEKDGMPWYHVSSLMGWKEPAAILYNVRAIPQNVLVDCDGKIVATNLRAEALYNKVQELSK